MHSCVRPLVNNCKESNLNAIRLTAKTAFYEQPFGTVLEITHDYANFAYHVLI
jgi:hypothetical protein